MTTTDVEAQQYLVGGVSLGVYALLALFWVAVLAWAVVFVIYGWNESAQRGLMVLAVYRACVVVAHWRAGKYIKTLKGDKAA